MKLFTNPGQDWEYQLTEEEVRELEANGYDTAELRAKRAKRQKEQNEEEEERKAFQNPTNLDKLKPYLLSLIHI